jgi:protein O-mannosyl-transferase
MRDPGHLGLFLPPLIFLIAGTVFLPALRGDFLNWDDSLNFVANPHYRGLGWPQIKWMLGATLMGHYIPVTWLSFGLNYALGGMNPWGYHLGNLILHAANTTLVYLITRRLLAAALEDGSQRGRVTNPVVLAATFAALVWGVHPLRVESVAWITERRDVLCGLFFLLTVLAYLKGIERGGHPRPVWRALSLAAFAAALLSKAAAMPLPAILLLLDFYPLRRAGWK